MSRLWRLGIIIQALCLLVALPATGEAFRLAVYDKDDSYMAGLLQLALDETGGDHTLKVLHYQVPQNRALRDLTDGNAPYNIFFSGYDPEREAALRLINIPLTRGLLGYRMLAIRSDDSARIAGIHSFDDLKEKVTFGAGASWPDTAIMKAAGLHVITGPDDSLWPMLARGRFAVYPRGVNEIRPELERIRRLYPGENITVVPNMMLAYRYDSFFYVAKNNEKLAQIVEHGLLRAYDDGRFMAYFSQHPDIRPMLEDLMSHERKIFWLHNPLMSGTVRAIPARFWQAVPGKQTAR